MLNSKLKICLLLCLIVLVCGQYAGATTWRILPDGLGDAPTIQAGIEAASNGDTVLVARGTHYEHSIFLREGILVVGDIDAPELVIIDAQGLGWVIDAESSTLFWYTRVKGITLTGGNPGGVRMYGMVGSAAVAFSHCIFRNNTGVGASIIFGNPEFWVPSIDHCEFIENTGVGLHVDSPLVSVTNCRFIANQNGGCALVGGSPQVNDCVFAGNVANNFGGLRIYDTMDALVEGCTFHGNSGSDASGIGGNSFLGSLTVTKSILAFGTWGQAMDCTQFGSVSLSCCDVYGNVGGDWIGCIAGQEGVDGNISSDPMFCAPDMGDFRLHDGSPCTEAGNPACGLIGSDPGICDVSGVGDFEVEYMVRTPILGDNVPNPFNPLTTIEFYLPGHSQVSLRVYSLGGRLVSTLADESMSPGNHAVQWRGRDDCGHAMAAGSYFYRLEAGKQVKTKKMTLLK